MMVPTRSCPQGRIALPRSWIMVGVQRSNSWWSLNVCYKKGVPPKNWFTWRWIEPTWKGKVRDVYNHLQRLLENLLWPSNAKEYDWVVRNGAIDASAYFWKEYLLI
jgi:hypothetical protein